MLGRLRRRSGLKPEDQPVPSAEAVGVYYLLRGQGVQLWRDGTALRVAFPRDADGGWLTPEDLLRDAITRNWLGLFQIVCAIEARHPILFDWLRPDRVSPNNPNFRTEFVIEPAGELERMESPVTVER